MLLKINYLNIYSVFWSLNVPEPAAVPEKGILGKDLLHRLHKCIFNILEA